MFDFDIFVFIMGVGLNLIVWDGGICGVVICLGCIFNEVLIEDNKVCVGVVVLDVMVVCKVVDVGLNLIFLCIIFGIIGGVVWMNVGCYGDYMVDVLDSIEVVYCDGICEILDKD